MSGGTFDYIQTKVEETARDMKRNLKDFDYNDTPEINEEVKKRIKKISKFALYISKLIREVDWYFAGDNGGESFLKCLEEIENKYGKMKIKKRKLNDKEDT